MKLDVTTVPLQNLLLEVLLEVSNFITSPPNAMLFSLSYTELGEVKIGFRRNRRR